jgi:hypothetical protein
MTPPGRKDTTMATTETRSTHAGAAPANGATKKTRARKSLDAATAASKIAAILKGLDSDERGKAMKILAVLTESA